MGEGGAEFADLSTWDREGMPERSAADLIRGLHAAIARWAPTDWQQTYPGDEDDGEPAIITRQWAIRHLIEHDLHHGGEISLTLGMHGVPGPNL